jgi:hypothetical protein
MELADIYARNARGEQLTKSDVKLLFTKIAELEALKSGVSTRKSSPDLVVIQRLAHQWLEWINTEGPKLKKRGDLGAFLAARTLPQLTDFCKLVLKL